MDASKLLESTDQPTAETSLISGREVLGALVKGAISELPGGSMATELWSVLRPSVSKRQTQLVEEVAKGLDNLKEQVDGFSLESLAENEAFISTTLEVFAIGVRTHQKVKLEAARNILLNAALPNPPDENMQKIFVTWLDQLTEWHLAMLKVSKARSLPEIEFSMLENGMPTSNLERLHDVFAAEYPSFEGRFYECIQLLKDLYTWGLVSNNTPTRGMLTAVNHAPVPTMVATQFLKFIESPLQDEKGEA